MVILSLQKQAVWIMHLAHIGFWELLPYTGNRQSINSLSMQNMGKLLVNQWLYSWMHPLCEVFCHIISLWELLRKTSWHFLWTHGAYDIPLLPDRVVRKVQVLRAKVCLHKWSSHRPPPALRLYRELCNTVTQPLPPFLHFLISCYSLHYRGPQKSNLDQDYILQDGVPNGTQSLPWESQTYTENLEEKNHHPCITEPVTRR